MDVSQMTTEEMKKFIIDELAKRLKSVIKPTHLNTRAELESALAGYRDDKMQPRYEILDGPVISADGRETYTIIDRQPSVVFTVVVGDQVVQELDPRRCPAVHPKTGAQCSVSRHRPHPALHVADGLTWCDEWEMPQHKSWDLRTLAESREEEAKMTSLGDLLVSMNAELKKQTED